MRRIPQGTPARQDLSQRFRLTVTENALAKRAEEKLEQWRRYAGACAEVPVEHARAIVPGADQLAEAGAVVLMLPGRAPADRAPEEPHARVLEALRASDPLFRSGDADRRRRDNWTASAMALLPAREAAALQWARAASGCLAGISEQLMLGGGVPAKVRAEAERRARAIFRAATDMTTEQFEQAWMLALVALASRHLAAEGRGVLVPLARRIVEAIEVAFPDSERCYRVEQVATALDVWRETEGRGVRGVSRWETMFRLFQNARGPGFVCSANALEEHHRGVRSRSPLWPETIELAASGAGYSVTASLGNAVADFSEARLEATEYSSNDALPATG